MSYTSLLGLASYFVKVVRPEVFDQADDLFSKFAPCIDVLMKVDQVLNIQASVMVDVQDVEHDLVLVEAHLWVDHWIKAFHEPQETNLASIIATGHVNVEKLPEEWGGIWKHLVDVIFEVFLGKEDGSLWNRLVLVTPSVNVSSNCQLQLVFLALENFECIE